MSAQPKNPVTSRYSHELEWLVNPGAFHAVRVGSTSMAIAVAAVIGLAFVSIVDFREIRYQKQEAQLNAKYAQYGQEQAAFAQWLEEKEQDFGRYLLLTGELPAAAPSNAAPQSSQVSYDQIRATIERVENRIRIVSDFQARDEEFFWYVPSIAPVALSEEFTLATGPLRRKDVARGLSGVSSTHGVRSHPLDGKSEMHYGLDIFCPDGTSVRATSNGTVAFVGRFSANEDNIRHSFGNFLRIEHGDTGIETLYAHLSKVFVVPGQVVKRGDTIALSGNTGASTGPHLHYEVVRNGVKVNPLNYINDVPLVQEGKKLFYVKNAKAAKGRRAGSKRI